MTDEELENRITLYAIMSRLMIGEVDEEFLKSIESNESILNLFPNYKKWDKRRKLGFDSLKERYLDVDYSNLFLLHLIPYESFYIRDDQMIESGGNNPVVQLYNRLDFRVKL